MRLVLAALLVVGIASLAVLPEPGSFLVALLVMLLVFLLGGAKLAIDLIESRAIDLVADAGLLVAVGVALSQIPLGNVPPTDLVLVVALATQALPRLRVAIPHR